MKERKEKKKQEKNQKEKKREVYENQRKKRKRKVMCKKKNKSSYVLGVIYVWFLGLSLNWWLWMLEVDVEGESGVV